MGQSSGNVRGYRLPPAQTFRLNTHLHGLYIMVISTTKNEFESRLAMFWIFNGTVNLDALIFIRGYGKSLLPRF
jgi:hypothetical protein